MFGNGRAVGRDHKLEIRKRTQSRQVHRHVTERGFEGIDSRRSDPRNMDVMCRPDQHDTLDRLGAAAKRRECRGRDTARVNIAGMRRNERLGCQSWRRRDLKIALDLDEQRSAYEEGFDRVTVEAFDA